MIGSIIGGCCGCVGCGGCCGCVGCGVGCGVDIGIGIVCGGCGVDIGVVVVNPFFILR